MTFHQRDAKAIFLNALEIKASTQRRQYLDRACAGNDALRDEVDDLLRHCEGNGSFLESAAPDLAALREQPLRERLGTRIGPYQLLEQIGEGGFGVVYLAEQQRPIRRKVALKILKPGMDTKQVMARFEAERQALALMDHPHIARVLEAGATDSGLPYFVMELVRGIPITEFCDHNRLTVRERLELFIAVCQAVQHAHQKGIIHRDLKPSNVLVALHDGTPLVKVIDFGIAKALGQERLTDKTLCSGQAQLLGTPLYMSPEQAEMGGQDVDTRTDIYSLGVLLYELLTGTTPFDKERLKRASYDELRRIIREEDPAKPSMRIRSLGPAANRISAERQTDPKRLSQRLCRELDWIVMKALEKERNRRYDAASAFAADVQHYLHDEPVQACPPSTGYRLRKFARRNRMALATALAALVVVLLVISGLVVSTVLIAREQQATTAALQAATAAKTDLEQTLERERQNAYFQRIALAEREWSANNLRGWEHLLEQCPADLRGWEWHYLKRLGHTTLPFLHYGNWVLCVAFSPSGDCFAAGGLGGGITIWDAQTGQRRLQIPAHEKRLYSVAFSPDGAHLASGGEEKMIKVWNVRTGQNFLTWEAHDVKVVSLAFSPDGGTLASGGQKLENGKLHGEVKLWNAASGQPLTTLPGSSQPGRWGPALAFSPDGRLLAAGREDAIDLWEPATGRRLPRLPGQTVGGQGITFSPDSRCLASAGGSWSTWADGAVALWDVQTGTAIRTLSGHTGSILSVAFSPDGQRLASAGMDMTIKLWDVTTGQEALTLRGHKDVIRALAFSPDGRKLVSASEDDTVHVWDATPLDDQASRAHRTLRGHRAGVFGVAFDPNGERLATVSADGTVKVWDTQSGKEQFTLGGKRGVLWSVAFSPDGQKLVAGGEFGELRLWDVARRQELLTLPGHMNNVTGVAFSPDGQLLVSSSWDYTLRICNATTGALLRKIPAHHYSVCGVAISRDGRYLASASSDRTLKIWDATTGQWLKTLEPYHAGRPSSVAFSPDGMRLASGSMDWTVKVWDSRSWQQERVLRSPTGGVESVAFSSDGRLVAGGITDGMVMVWDAATGEEIRRLRGHTSRVQSVAFRPDGRQLASGSLDGTAKLWTMDTFGNPEDQ